MHQREAKQYILPSNAVQSFFRPFFPCLDVDLGSDLLDPLHYSDQKKKKKQGKVIEIRVHSPLCRMVLN